MCGVYDTYGDGSGAQGYLAHENITLNGLSGTATIAVVLYEKGGQDQQQFEPPVVDGIMVRRFQK